MSKIEVTQIASSNGVDPVYFPDGIVGDGTALSFFPEIVSITPTPFSNAAPLDTNISITFDQNIEFSTPSGTIELRRGSSSGTIVESYITGSSGNLSIVDDTLTINPTSDLLPGITYHVILPSVGIANTFGANFRGNSNYSFTAAYPELQLNGGTHVFTRADGGSPTGYYKYHVFLGTGTLEFNAPSDSDPSFALVAVAGGGSGGAGYSPANTAGGGGGGGGVYYGPGPNFIPIPGPATYTVTIGSGGTRIPSSGPQTPANNGTDTTMGTTPTSFVLVAVGGGAGGSYPAPTSGTGLPGGSGGGGAGQPRPGIDPIYPTRGYYSWGNGYAVPGQGFTGGNGGRGYNNGYGNFWAGGGGGGAGSSGSPATYPSYDGPTYWPTNTTSPIWNVVGGNGGSGRPFPGFSYPVLNGNVPLIPSDTLTEIGPTGRFGGGGGGGSPSTVPFATRSGQGGPGGGGHGAFVGWPPASYPINPSPFAPETGSNYHAQDGFQYTGGGGGGGTAPNPTYNNGAGGSGIFMVRYAVPSL